MPVSDRDRSRLAALIAIVKPAHSLAARLDALTDEQRDYYNRWEARYEQWTARCNATHDDEIEIEARPYARMLEGYGPPAMRRDVETALFGETPKILLTETDDTAARKWMDQLQCS
ncbi:hypothetical protein G6321_00019120 [Bradyrhizobium barranii subsp. barranii]|uniref:Uncharacterized protein n=1 Tax=Bradyrhizobium barranii subsp. barranii TaxID=2823807 RepID=A0A7Z0QM82_9BRAD|nr:hypothetical protein [Bradyrhizobium barranii]UGX97124.1 hypothetical protein G6321_00019120 [Bradyrhizobium barranii subsp. barranii]